MKKNTALITLCLTTILALSSCQSDTHEIIQQVSSIETPSELVKKYMDENSYIELDVHELAKDIAKIPTTRTAPVNQEQLAQMKVALYRFYSHVELVGDTYVCKLTSAKDINVSVDVYTALLNNLNDINASIQEAKQKGQKVVIPKVDKAYLDSLLK